MDENARIIAKSIVGFANELGAKSVAEFVHSQTVLDTVMELRIDYSQGYHISELYQNCQNIKHNVNFSI